LGDAGYHTLEVLSELAAREIDVLIPAGRTYVQQPWEKRKSKRKLPKSAFRYEAEADVYHCPGQRILARAGGDRDRHGRRYVRYRGDCRGCALRDHCTKSKASRVLKRYAGEEIKEAMAWSYPVSMDGVGLAVRLSVCWVATTVRERGARPAPDLKRATRLRPTCMPAAISSS
jgi:hypothetical protein